MCIGGELAVLLRQFHHMRVRVVDLLEVRARDPHSVLTVELSLSARSHSSLRSLKHPVGLLLISTPVGHCSSAKDGLRDIAVHRQKSAVHKRGIRFMSSPS
jgi:hypothetical protein